MKEDLDKGSELWNLKLLEISKYKVSKAEKITKAKQEKFLELQRIKQKEKEKNILHNISQNELLEEYERQRNLNAINAKLKKVMFQMIDRGAELCSRLTCLLIFCDIKTNNCDADEKQKMHL